MNRSEFAKCVALLSASVGKDMQQAQAEAWYLLLQDLTADELQAGIAGSLQAHTYGGFPPVGLIRQHARPALQGLKCDADTAALAAWSGVVDAMRSLGGYASVDFGPVVNAVVRSLGGWVRLTEQPSEDLLRFVRPQFLQTFKALSAVGVREAEAAPLAGLADIDNSRKGLPVQEAKPVDLRLPGAAPRVLPALTAPRQRLRIAATDDTDPGTLAEPLREVATG